MTGLECQIYYIVIYVLLAINSTSDNAYSRVPVTIRASVILCFNVFSIKKTLKLKKKANLLRHTYLSEYMVPDGAGKLMTWHQI